MKLKFVVDVASVEIFADESSTVMTAIYFPDEMLDQIEILSVSQLSFSSLKFSKLN